jgi:hypothetical protein
MLFYTYNQIVKALPRLPLLEDAIALTFRRSLRSLTNGYPDFFNIVVVDVNNTLVNGSVEYELLKDKIGEDKAKSTFEYLDYLKENGKLTGNKWLLGAVQTMSEKGNGITNEDVHNTLQRLLNEGRINLELVHIFQERKNNGAKVIVMTKGSCSYVAEWLAEKFGFDAGYGPKLDGAHNVHELIGLNNKPIKGVKGVVIKTRLDKVKEFCKSDKGKGITFDMSKIAFVTDHIDSREMRGCVVVLYAPNEESVKSQHTAARFGTYDVKFGKDEHEKMHIFLSNPKMAGQLIKEKARKFAFANTN